MKIPLMYLNMAIILCSNINFYNMEDSLKKAVEAIESNSVEVNWICETSKEEKDTAKSGDEDFDKELLDFHKELLDLDLDLDIDFISFDDSMDVDFISFDDSMDIDFISFDDSMDVDFISFDDSMDVDLKLQTLDKICDDRDIDQNKYLQNLKTTSKISIRTVNEIAPCGNYLESKVKPCDNYIESKVVPCDNYIEGWCPEIGGVFGKNAFNLRKNFKSRNLIS